MSFRFRPNPLLEKELLVSGAAALAVREAAHEAATEAERIGQEVSNSYHVDVTSEGTGVRLEANARGINPASWIEFGTEHLRAAAPLRRGAEAAGLKASK